MDSIKQRISRRANYRQLEMKRMAFKKKMPQLHFHDIEIEGANDQQKKYIKKEFHTNEDGSFD